MSDNLRQENLSLLKELYAARRELVQQKYAASNRIERTRIDIVLTQTNTNIAELEAELGIQHTPTPLSEQELKELEKQATLPGQPQLTTPTQAPNTNYQNSNAGNSGGINMTGGSIGTVSFNNPGSGAPTPASNASPKKLQVFLCHAPGDSQAASQLYSRLEQEGFKPWLDDEDVFPGQDWKLETRKAIKASQAVVVCLSRKFSEAGSFQSDTKFALDESLNQPEGAVFLIPLLLEQCEIPERLKEFKPLDFTNPRGYERLLKALQFRASSLGLA